MRIDVKKYLFIGMEEERQQFFKKAQELGIIHFIDIKLKSKEVPQAIANVTGAIKILRGLPTLEQVDVTDFALADGIAAKILQLESDIEKLQEAIRVTNLEISRVEVFGEYSQDDFHYIEKQAQRKFQFYFGKHEVVHEDLPDEIIYVGSDHGLDYFIALNDQPKQYENLIEMHVDKHVGELKSQKLDAQKQLHEKEKRLRSFAKYRTFLHHALVNAMNKYQLKSTRESAQQAMDNTLFFIEGWVPVNKISSLFVLADKMNVYMEEVAVEPQDAVPTYLENQGFERIGEDVIEIYDTPSSKDRDPSLWVLISFAFFFAVIVGDAGYGTIFLAIAMYLRYKFSAIKGVKKRILNLFTLLAFACIAWGVLTNSFFGIPFAPDSPVRKISLIHWLVVKKTEYHMERHDSVYQTWVQKYPQLSEVTDPETFVAAASKADESGAISYELINKFSDNIMLELALLIGVIHIVISMLRYLNRNWVNLGWIFFIIGGYLYFPSYLGGTSILNVLFDVDPAVVATEGYYLMIGGLLLAVVISLFKNKWLGLVEFMTSIQVFSDIMSYLRLYALGIAGAIMTATINESAAGLPLIFAVILMLVGHTINMALAVMGGIIHGLRLNFLEWYHYSFEGGGIRFKPLKKVHIE